MLRRIASIPLCQPVAYPAPRQSGFTRIKVRSFVNTPSFQVLRPYLLADIGEGITECQVTTWNVKEGDVVEQFDPICEVQSDKASVEITSRFKGEIKKLYYDEGAMAKVGAPLVDMDIVEEDNAEYVAGDPVTADKGVLQDMQNIDTKAVPEDKVPPSEQEINSSAPASPLTNSTPGNLVSEPAEQERQPSPNNAVLLATPAVRRLLRQNDLDISDMKGTGKDGRVLKEDVMRYMQTSPGKIAQLEPADSQSFPERIIVRSGDQRNALTSIQGHMFKTMTASLAIPHLLYTQTVDLTALMELVRACRRDPSLASHLVDDAGHSTKLTVLPFILKALSQSFAKFPIMNSLLDVGESGENAPTLITKSSHDFGIAVDTPTGLLVPVIKDVQNRSVVAIASETSRLADLAKSSKIGPGYMKGASFTISNIGSIGGNVVGPVIMPPMVAIMAIGKVEDVLALEAGNDGVEKLVRKKKAVLSWSADHRVLDGATVARCAQDVAKWLERPELLGLSLR